MALGPLNEKAKINMATKGAPNIQTGTRSIMMTPENVELTTWIACEPLTARTHLGPSRLQYRRILAECSASQALSRVGSFSRPWRVMPVSQPFTR